MATVKIVQPKIGSLTVIDSNHSHYVVRFNPPVDIGGDYEVGPIKVYCEACKQTLLSSDENPATFDLTSLENSGHPGPYDISIEITSEAWFVVTTSSAGNGKTSPVERVIPTKIGYTVNYTITATPDDGYVFDRWESSTGKTYDTARVSLSATVTSGSDSRHYVAYFKKRTYYVYVLRKRALDVAGSLDRRLSQDSTISSVAGPRTVYYSARGTGDVAVAVVYSNKISAYADSDVTLTVEMLPAATTYGVRFIGWFESVSGKGGSETSFVVHVYNSNVTVRAYFTVEAVKVKFIVKTPLYGLVSNGGDGELIGTEKGFFPNGEQITGGYSRYSSITLAVAKNTRFNISLYLWKYYLPPPEKMTREALLAFCHGSSSGKFEPPPETVDMNSYFTSGEEDEEVFIYLCTHLLVHAPDGALGHKNPSLVYDCHNPEAY